jgi:endogenous inhibitor of DNA gyrase (YacG/DUF329 family)
VRVNDGDATGAPPPRRRVRCPACAAETAYHAGNPWRPFCSRRCRELDFGAWASERYRVEAPDAAEAADPPAPTASRDA